MTESDRSGSVATVALAEFTALRAEINARSTAQYVLMNLNLTAVGLVVGAVLSGKTDLRVLLLLPLICSCFGLLFFDHGAQIENLGIYIATRIRPLVLDAVGNDPRLFSWEEAYRLENTKRAPLLLRFGVPILIIFLGAPVGSTIATLGATDSAWTWVVWSVGVVLELLLFSLWVSLTRKWSPRASPPLRPAGARRPVGPVGR